MGKRGAGVWTQVWLTPEFRPRYSWLWTKTQIQTVYRTLFPHSLPFGLTMSSLRVRFRAPASWYTNPAVLKKYSEMPRYTMRSWSAGKAIGGGAKGGELRWARLKNSPCRQRQQSEPGFQELQFDVSIPGKNWHHWLDGHEFEQTLGVCDGQGGLACCSSWGRKESNTTEWLNCLTELKDTNSGFTEEKAMAWN